MMEPNDLIYSSDQLDVYESEDMYNIHFQQSCVYINKEEFIGSGNNINELIKSLEKEGLNYFLNDNQGGN